MLMLISLREMFGRGGKGGTVSHKTCWQDPPDIVPTATFTNRLVRHEQLMLPT